MVKSWIREVLFHKGAPAVFALSLAATLAAPAWAQRGAGRPMGAPMSIPRMSMPPMSPPVSQPMPRVGPAAMPPVERIPRSLPPAERMPRSMPPAGRMPQPRYSPPVARASAPVYAAPPRKRGTPSSPAGAPVRAYIPAASEGVRIPVYTPMTSDSYRVRVNALRPLPSAYAGQTYWGGYAWNPFFPGFGIFDDPFDFLFLTSSGCFGFSSFSSFTFDPFSAQFAFPPFENPFFGSSFFCGEPFAPAFFGQFGSFGMFQPFCAQCNTLQFDTLAFGLDNSSFLDALSNSSRSSPSGAFSNVIAARASASSLTGNSFGSGSTAFSAPAAAPTNAFSTGDFAAPTQEGNVLANEGFSGAFALPQPPSGQPVTLIFANGFTIEATQYWLGGDNNLHYVTTAGAQMSAPLSDFDMSATMAANNKNGVRFLTPASAEPQPASKQQ